MAQRHNDVPIGLEGDLPTYKTQRKIGTYPCLAKADGDSLNLRKRKPLSVNKTADILADPTFHGDGEARLGWNVEEGSGLVANFGFTIVELNGAVARHDLHALGFIRPKVVMAGINEPERLFAAISKDDAVANHFPIKINIGLRDGGDVGKLRWDRAHSVRRLNKASPPPQAFVAKMKKKGRSEI